MKLRDCLNEAGSWAGPPSYSNYHGGAAGKFTSYGSSYRPSVLTHGDDPVSSKVDSDIERQLIDQAIDMLFNEYPELIQDKKVKRMHIQMLLGKITKGEVSDLIDVENFIKRLKKLKKIKVV